MSVLSTKMMQAAAGGVNPAWDLSYAYYDPPAVWDISTATYASKSFSVASQEISPQGLFFKFDGTKMYVTGSEGDDVNEYNLSTAWDISTTSYSRAFSVASQETSPRDIFFKPDGTKMYILGYIGDDVNEYSLSTAWDVSSASYSQNFSIAAQETRPEGLFFKPDGTKMYVVGTDTDAVYEYSLSTAWDVSSASYSQNFSISGVEGAATGISFKSDGTKMYILGQGTVAVNEYNLSTAWDVSSASYSQNFSIAAQEPVSPTSLYFKPDGTGFYHVGVGTDTVYQYQIGVFVVTAQEASPRAMFVGDNGAKIYVSGTSGDDVNEYNLSTAWDTSTASYLQNYSVAGRDSVPQGLFFKPDGLKLYVMGASNRNVLEYDLSTAWDVSTASYLQAFNVNAQESGPHGLFFKPDGLKMYFAGNVTDSVLEYDLSTAWDVSTASYLQSFSVTSQEISPTDVFFKPDGTRMYVIGVASDLCLQYNLSTSWDISTASFIQSIDLSAQDIQPRAIHFKDDGIQMLILGGNTDGIYSYTLGVQP